MQTDMKKNAHLFRREGAVRLARFLAVLLFLPCPEVRAQGIAAPIYDESLVPEYVLPEILTCEDGSQVTSKRQWERKRRPEIMEMFQSKVYGRTPSRRIKVENTLLKETAALDGTAVMRQVRMRFSNGQKHVDAYLMILRPADSKGRVPLFVGLNFNGNHTVLSDPEVLISPGYRYASVRKANPDDSRGTAAHKWDLRTILARGYGVATMCYHDIYPDRREVGFVDESVIGLFPDFVPGREPSGDDWQAIGAWAWGVSRIVDYLWSQKWVDRKGLIVMGHSRLGKTALWAGAQDTRFSVVISNDSGCGGAALSKRCYGESVAKINNSFPHWFCPAFHAFSANEQSMPFDQHELLALVAPRALYVASAQEDRWADPKGEFLAAANAGPVYHLYGLRGLETMQMPGVHQPIMNSVGYHVREGGHSVKPYDWACYLDFCDMHIRKSH